jgi:hypothetical protein
VRSEGLRSRQQWRDWRQRPADVPARPDVVYRRGGWLSWAHWLGAPSAESLPFHQVIRSSDCIHLN